MLRSVLSSQAVSAVLVALLAFVAPIAADDCNGNGIPDDQDIANGTSWDCYPSNGVPDECQPPCTVYNGDWATGDEADWTRFEASWGSGVSWAVTSNGPTPPEGTVSFGPTASGSCGWYQIVPAVPASTLSVDADWSGDVSSSGAAEVMLFNAFSLAHDDILAQIDAGNVSDIAYKKDVWGLNPPPTWDWEPASLSLDPGGNGGLIGVSAAHIVVALKCTSFSGNAWCSWDNISTSASSCLGADCN